MRAHESWADFYDLAYELTYGAAYQELTKATVAAVSDLDNPPCKIVDFGAGTGRLAVPLRELGYDVTAVERSGAMCRVLKAKAESHPEQEGTRTAPYRPGNLVVLNQSITQKLPDADYAAGVCVFSVLNYIVNEADLRCFATAAAASIRPGGRLLISFVTDMAPMRRFFSGNPKRGTAQDGSVRIERNISIQPREGTLYEYQEESEIIQGQNSFRYSDRFLLREWTGQQVVDAMQNAGFREQCELKEFAWTGEVHLLFSRNPDRPQGLEQNPNVAVARLLELQNFADAGDALRQRRTRTGRQRTAQRLLENIHEHQVFYYPGAGTDYEPLRRLTHVCDTFIFCDPGVVSDHVCGDFKFSGLATEFVVPLTREDLEYLTEKTALPSRLAARLQKIGERADGPWGKYARLSRTVGEATKTIHFFYLGMEGNTVYYNLFAPAKTAPRVLCMKFGMDPNGWLFGNWSEGVLGQIIRGIGALPEQTIGIGGPGSEWPHNFLWQRFSGWPGSPAAFTTQMSEPIQATPQKGCRQVIVKEGCLTPGTVNGSEAIVLPIEGYLKERELWPEKAKLLLLVPPDQKGRLAHRDERVEFIGSKRRPLAEVLASVTRACECLGIKSVSSIGIGYEDEGPALDAWRRGSGRPLKLTIHCKHKGDLASLAPHADRLEQS